VFVALDKELHREVALKQIQPAHADDPNSRARFLIEGEVTGRLEHPGIVPVYGLGTSDRGRPFYAMRFVRGENLKEAIDSFHEADSNPSRDAAERARSLRQLLRRFVDVCNAIAYAHSRGVIHRDLKPANILLGPYGETLVVDWGLAKVVGRSPDEPSETSEGWPLAPSPASVRSELPLSLSVTGGDSAHWASSGGDSADWVSSASGLPLGTPAYMAPEQAARDLDRLGPRSDVYNLGATLYHLLTGRPPFEGNDVGAVLRAVLRAEFQTPRELDSSIDPALEAVCLRAMATQPEERYASCLALVDDVERWMAGQPVAAWDRPWWRSLDRLWPRLFSAAQARVSGKP
jgi:serine/threonine protein kinase